MLHVAREWLILISISWDTWIGKSSWGLVRHVCTGKYSVEQLQCIEKGFVKFILVFPNIKLCKRVTKSGLISSVLVNWAWSIMQYITDYQNLSVCDDYSKSSSSKIFARCFVAKSPASFWSSPPSSSSSSSSSSPSSAYTSSFGFQTCNTLSSLTPPKHQS